MSDCNNEEEQPEGQPPEEQSQGNGRVIIPLGNLRSVEADSDAVEQADPAPDDEMTAEAEPAAAAEGEPLAGELTDDELKGIIEALLFSAPTPLSGRKLAELSGAGDARVVRRIVEALGEDYDSQARAFTVEEVAGGYLLFTRPDFHPWVGKLHRREQEDTLSQAALEALAIVAYKQPITRAQIEDIRGVQSGYILRSLIEKSLVRVAGRSEELGRPLLYGTTAIFLELFGLPSLKELPKLGELNPSADGS